MISTSTAPLMLASIGARLKQARLSAGLTYTDIQRLTKTAKQAGVSAQSASQIENKPDQGFRMITLARIVVQALDKSLRDVLGDNPKMLVAYQLLEDRVRAEIGQDTLSDMSGVDNSTISLLEQGKMWGSDTVLRKLAAVYERDADFYIKLRDEARARISGAIGDYPALDTTHPYEPDETPEPLTGEADPDTTNPDEIAPVGHSTTYFDGQANPPGFVTLPEWDQQAPYLDQVETTLESVARFRQEPEAVYGPDADPPNLFVHDPSDYEGAEVDTAAAPPPPWAQDGHGIRINHYGSEITFAPPESRQIPTLAQRFDVLHSTCKYVSVESTFDGVLRIGIGTPVETHLLGWTVTIRISDSDQGPLTKYVKQAGFAELGKGSDVDLTMMLAHEAAQDAALTALGY